MNSLNLTWVSFFWIWAKCQARKMTTSRDIHNMTVLRVAFTIPLPPTSSGVARLSSPVPRPHGKYLLYAPPGPKWPRGWSGVGEPAVSLRVGPGVAAEETGPHRLRQREGRPVRVDIDLALAGLVHEGAHAQAARALLPDVVEEEAQRDPRVDDVVEEEDVAPLVGDGRGVEDLGVGRPRVLSPLR